MDKPVVAIVGRPNVGKSRLFNRLVGERIAIVEGEPGVTRDRIYNEVSWQDRSFILVDTGGLDPENESDIKKKIKYQVQVAMEEAEILLFIVDGKTGITKIDEKVAQTLRETNKKVILVINKIDNFEEKEESIWEFYSLGFGEPIPISAEHGKNTGNLLDSIVGNLPRHKDEKNDEKILDIAIVGKPNVGKSTLVNSFAGEERVIVNNTPGTTRDAIDTVVKRNDLKYNLIDTAGLRKKSKVEEDVEYYSNIRAIDAIERADGVLMMIDALEGVTEQDKKIAGYAHEAGKAIVIAVNKWDLIDKSENNLERYEDNIYYEMSFLNYAPVTFISAKTGKRIDQALELLEYSIDEASKRIKTSVLNEVIEDAVEARQPPFNKGNRIKIFYVTQVEIKPPTILMFVNDPELMHFSYKRYLKNVLRENFGFIGSPIKILLKTS